MAKINYNQAKRILGVGRTKIDELIRNGYLIVIGRSTGLGPKLKMFDSKEVYTLESNRSKVIGRRIAPRAKKG